MSWRNSIIQTYTSAPWSVPLPEVQKYLRLVDEERNRASQIAKLKNKWARQKAAAIVASPSAAPIAPTASLTPPTPPTP